LRLGGVKGFPTAIMVMGVWLAAGGGERRRLLSHRPFRTSIGRSRVSRWIGGPFLYDICFQTIIVNPNFTVKGIQPVQRGRHLSLREIPLRALGPRDVVVQVRAAVFCHSDAHYRAGRSPVRPLPLTLGHEVAGVVEKVGTEVSQFSAGD